MWPRSSTRWSTPCEKKMTHQYKAKLTKDQRKTFRSQMWAFRRDPESLSTEEKQALEALFEKIPALRPLYQGERSISFGSRGDPCCSRKCLPLKMIPASRL